VAPEQLQGRPEQPAGRQQQRAQLLLCLSLLRHLAYKSSGARAALARAGLMGTALRAWQAAVAAHGEELLHELLALLANALPRCPAAAEQLAGAAGQGLLLQNLLELLLAAGTEVRGAPALAALAMRARLPPCSPPLGGAGGGLLPSCPQGRQAHLRGKQAGGGDCACWLPGLLRLAPPPGPRRLEGWS
jgi:hypothetical protein